MGPKRKRPADEEEEPCYHINDDGNVVLLNHVGQAAQKDNPTPTEAQDCSSSGMGVMMHRENEQVRQAFQRIAAEDPLPSNVQLHFGSAQVHLTGKDFARGLRNVLHQHSDHPSEINPGDSIVTKVTTQTSFGPHSEDSTIDGLAAGSLSQQTSDWMNEAGNYFAPTINYNMAMYDRLSAGNAVFAAQPNDSRDHTSFSMLPSGPACIGPVPLESSDDDPTEESEFVTQRPFHKRTRLLPAIEAPNYDTSESSLLFLGNYNDSDIFEFEEAFINYEAGFNINNSIADLALTVTADFDNNAGFAMSLDQLRSTENSNGSFSTDNTVSMQAQQPENFLGDISPLDHSNCSPDTELERLSCIVATSVEQQRGAELKRVGELDKHNFAQDERQLCDKPYSHERRAHGSSINADNNKSVLAEDSAGSGNCFMRAEQDLGSKEDVADFQRFVEAGEKMAKNMEEMRENEVGLRNVNLAMDAAIRLSDHSNIHCANEKPDDLIFPAVLGLGDYGPNDALLKKKLLTLHQEQEERKRAQKDLQEMMRAAIQTELTTGDFASSYSMQFIPQNISAQRSVHSQDSDLEQKPTEITATSRIPDVSSPFLPVQKERREVGVWRHDYAFLMSRERFDMESELIRQENLRLYQEERLQNKRSVKSTKNSDHRNHDSWDKPNEQFTSLDESDEEWNALEKSKSSKTAAKKNDEDAMLPVAKKQRMSMNVASQFKPHRDLNPKYNRQTSEHTTNYASNTGSKHCGNASDSIVSTQLRQPSHDLHRRQSQQFPKALYKTPQVQDERDDPGSPDDTPIPLILPISTKKPDRHTLSILFYSEHLMRNGLANFEQVVKEHRQFSSVKIVANFQENFGSSVVGKISGDALIDLIDLVKRSIDSNTYSHLSYD